MLRNLGSCCHIIWGVNKRKNKSIRTNVRVFCVWFGGWVGGGGGVCVEEGDAAEFGVLWLGLGFGVGLLRGWEGWGGLVWWV